MATTSREEDEFKRVAEGKTTIFGKKGLRCILSLEGVLLIFSGIVVWTSITFLSEYRESQAKFLKDRTRELEFRLFEFGLVATAISLFIVMLVQFLRLSDVTFRGCTVALQQWETGRKFTIFMTIVAWALDLYYKGGHWEFFVISFGYQLLSASFVLGYSHRYLGTSMFCKCGYGQRMEEKLRKTPCEVTGSIV